MGTEFDSALSSEISVSTCKPSLLDLPVEMLVQVLAHCDANTLQACDATCSTLRNVISFHGRELCESASMTLPSKTFRRSYPDFPYREFALYRPLDGDFARCFKLTDFGDNTLIKFEEYGLRVELRERKPYGVAYAETTFRCVTYRSDDVHHKIYNVFEALQPTIRIELRGSTTYCEDYGVLHFCRDCTRFEEFLECKIEDGSQVEPFQELYCDSDDASTYFDIKFSLPWNELRPHSFVFFRNAWAMEVEMKIELPL